MTGWDLAGVQFCFRLFCLLSVYNSAPNSTSNGPFTSCFNLVDFMELELGFHGHVGPCRMSSVFRPIFGCINLCVYIYMFMWLCS